MDAQINLTLWPTAEYGCVLVHARFLGILGQIAQNNSDPLIKLYMSSPSTDNQSHPYAVWEQTHTGRTLRVFPDEYLAMQFAVDNGAQVIENPTDY